MLPPLYPAGLSPEGIIGYLRSLGDEAEVPFILYNFRRCSATIIRVRSTEIVDAGQ